MAERRKFRMMNPPKQKFTKTDVAKFTHSWMQFPYLVSLGAEKNFREFMLRLPPHAANSVDPGYFSELVAKAILVPQDREDSIRPQIRRLRGKYRNVLYRQALTLDRAAARP